MSITEGFADRTIVKARVLQDVFNVEVYGTPDVVADIGESVAWLASALQRSGRDLGLASCSPFIKGIVSRNDVVSCQVHFVVSHVEKDTSSLNGLCWQTMFRDPVLVAGFPILRRPSSGTGLEAPLNLMAGLVQTRRVHSFMGRIFLKGFSSMLVGVGNIDGVYIWHHYCTSDGSRISYLNANEHKVDELRLHTLAASRHIVGWCTDATYMAGRFCSVFYQAKVDC